MEEIVKSLLESNQELTKQLIEANKVLAAIAKTVVERGDPIKVEKPQEEVEWASYPLHVSEGEEDAKHMLESGQIDKTEYEEMLRSFGLEPTIEFFTD